ncbi:cobalamin biosynthesis protein [Rhodococcus sp. HNM0569]|uniref:cobalamin biosynthesis protein n=1 Tax=Rhodococcus sp. HNM0569 TaxID=2716340 RepID=UPI00146E65FB|nr:cobalamin biosynthesis protein [Rhodococcus sp. HNM0569]
MSSVKAFSRVACSRALGLALGYGADLVFADPRRGHPVAGFGTAAARIERATYRDRRAAGAAHVAVLVGGIVAAGAFVERRAAAAGPVGHVCVTALATWAVLGGTSLARVGEHMADALDSAPAGPDLDTARALLPSLCGRDPHSLDPDGLARAALESIAENTSDATVGPLVWGAVAGVPGLLGYRAINTLDAMIGYRSPRHLRFGWAAARLDDLVNLVPARVAGVLTVAAAPVVGGRPGDAWRVWRRDAGAHPSPNAGVAEASAAGALGVTLGGRTEYAYGIEERPRLGDGPPPGTRDLRRAVSLSRAVQAAATGASAVVAVAVGELGRRRGRR